MINFKKIVKSYIEFLGFRVGQAFSPGLSIFGYTIFKDPFPRSKNYHSSIALEHALQIEGHRVLDVGSGGGRHALAFVEAGFEVVCVDFMTSVYAKNTNQNALSIFKGNFLDYSPVELFDIVWASHVLEHQRNIGEFLEHLLKCTKNNGLIYITVPDPHHKLWGGHLSVWSPGLLAYNLVVCGVDLSESSCIRGVEEFTLICRNKRIKLPELTYDFGDIIKLKPFLPNEIHENQSGWIYWNRLS